MEYEYSKLITHIRSLAVFSELKKDPVIGRICELLCAIEEARGKGNTSLLDSTQIVDLYSDIISNLYPATSDLGEYIQRAVLADDNFYIEAMACGDEISDEIQSAVKRELIGLGQIASLSSQQIKAAVKDICSLPIDSLPSWTNKRIDLLSDFMEKLNNLSTSGYGIFADHSFFRIDDEDIVPVPHPDVQDMAQLFGYERQKDLIIKNTRALLDRDGTASANNILLYGDAGTGKSSTVKSIAFAYAKEGLRLIEIKKEQLHQITSVLEKISRQPLRFILFVDDLSFSSNDDNFSALKATLEGSIAGRGDNAVIYATSNRRHLIRETFADRQGDELHVNDTLQETMSLAARFGLTIMFENPDKDEYLDIVKNLADLYGIDIPEEELFNKAEAHAIRRNGRSPRTARQFIDLLRSGIGS